mgnify:CR=1 FL=1
MNAKDYGHHFSGYRRSDECEPSQGFMHRLVLWIVAYAVCVGWMMTHMGARIPSKTASPRSLASVSCRSD